MPQIEISDYQLNLAAERTRNAAVAVAAAKAARDADALVAAREALRESRLELLAIVDGNSDTSVDEWELPPAAEEPTASDEATA